MNLDKGLSEEAVSEYLRLFKETLYLSLFFSNPEDEIVLVLEDISAPMDLLKSKSFKEALTNFIHQRVCNSNYPLDHLEKISIKIQEEFGIKLNKVPHSCSYIDDIISEFDNEYIKLEENKTFRFNQKEETSSIDLTINQIKKDITKTKKDTKRYLEFKSQIENLEDYKKTLEQRPLPHTTTPIMEFLEENHISDVVDALESMRVFNREIRILVGETISELNRALKIALRGYDTVAYLSKADFFIEFNNAERYEKYMPESNLLKEIEDLSSCDSMAFNIYRQMVEECLALKKVNQKDIEEYLANNKVVAFDNWMNLVDRAIDGAFSKYVDKVQRIGA